MLGISIAKKAQEENKRRSMYHVILRPTEETEYDKKAHDFLEYHQAVISYRFDGWKKYFEDDKECRNTYLIRIERLGVKIEFTFGQSLHDSGLNIHPIAYNILSCLEKNFHDSFEDFCLDYGYDPDSRKAEKIYHECQKQAEDVNMIFGDCLDELREIN